MFIKVYRLLVINLVTGPRAIDIEINLPVMLARDLADRALACRASFSWLQRAAIFLVGPLTCPSPNQYQTPASTTVASASTHTFQYAQ